MSSFGMLSGITYKKDQHENFCQGQTLQLICSKRYGIKSFITLAPGINLIKHICYKFTHTFYKLDQFIIAHHICLNAVNRSSLQKINSQFTLNKVDETNYLMQTAEALEFCKSSETRVI